jgi:hypothetical protein
MPAPDTAQEQAMNPANTETKSRSRRLFCALAALAATAALHAAPA